MCGMTGQRFEQVEEGHALTWVQLGSLAA
jgi:hypothetical protein